MSPEAFADLKRAKRQNYELIYHNEGVIKGAGNVVQEMFGELYEKLRADAVRRDETRRSIATTSASSRRNRARCAPTSTWRTVPTRWSRTTSPL